MSAVDEGFIPPGPDWVPGDPLYPRGSYRDYFFNFRDDADHECATDDCAGGDSASWPHPRGGQDLGETDELTRARAREERAVHRAASIARFGGGRP